MTLVTVSVNQDIRAEARATAAAFREQMTAQGTFVARLLSSPGSGKTTLLAETAKRLARDHRVGILVGDVETDRDAQRLSPYAPTTQITTGGACHLELPLISKALPSLGDEPFDFLFLEDIGNLICPASHDLGEHLRVILLSVTEGDDKPRKYPKAFRTSDVMVITKTDLLPYVPFSVEEAIRDARCVRPDIQAISVCGLSGQGMDDWIELLTSLRRAQQVGAASPS